MPTAELVTAATAGAVAAELGLVPDPSAVAARALSGGISNIVLALEWEGGRAVLKQSLPRLRVATEWVFDRSRIVNERRCMALLGDVLDDGAVPTVLAHDDERYLFMMSHADDGGAVWKDELLAGRVDLPTARRAGEMLGRIHAATADDPWVAATFADQGPLLQGPGRPLPPDGRRREPGRGRHLDSRGRPTVEAELGLSDGTTSSASVPSGASTGRHEAVERRDGDSARYRGRGVLGAVAAVGGEIADALTGMAPEQAAVDARLIGLDGTPDKSRLGANATLAVSLACARAEAAIAGAPLWRHLAREREPMLPLPMVNILSGGLHAGRQLDFQDFLAIPVGAATYREALRWIAELYEATADVLRERGLSTLKADEGGFGPGVPSHRAALELLDTAVRRAGRRPGDDIAYALDIAATHFHDAASGCYVLASEDRRCTPEELTAIIGELATDHPIVSVEDALAEDDWDGWTSVTAALGDRMQVVGDDLFTTNIDRLERGIAIGAANAVLVKMNQIGTITETLAVVQRAKAAGYRTVISARSGETEDPALADLAVGTAGGQIKVGSVAQSERLAKYNRLLRIEEALGGEDAPYAGRAALALEPVR